jgi:peptidoglycan-associated lipoprotein
MMKLNKYSTIAVVVFAAAGLMMGGCAKKTVNANGQANVGGMNAGKPETHGVNNMNGMATMPADHSVYFDFDKSDITAKGAAILDANATWLNAHPQSAVTVEGNCDQRGTREYNLALGQRRADSVKAYLVAHGANAANITTVSFGKEKPVCEGTGENCWSQNRRADIVVH